METILFNKNHVKITCNGIKSAEGKYRVAWTTYYETIYPKGMTMTNVSTKREPVIKESPLGFYYASMQEVKVETEAQMSSRIQFHKIAIYVYTKCYEIYYPVECNGVKIGFDARPWDICIGDMSMRDNFIKALKKILDDIFEAAVPIKGIARTKEKVYTDIFGSPNGYSTVANDIKILSHGFDPKESFRKVKKKKK